MVLQATVEKTTDGYSAYAIYENNTITAVGDTYTELKQAMQRALAFHIRELEKDGVDITKWKTATIEFKLDVKSLFDLFPSINTSGFASFIGMNRSLMSQYINGLKKPSEQQAEKILNGIHNLGRYYLEVKF